LRSNFTPEVKIYNRKFDPNQFFHEKVDTVRQNTAGAPEPTFSTAWPGASLVSFTLEPQLNKMLSYHRETALQGTLVLSESGRLELRQYFTDIVSLASTTVT